MNELRIWGVCNMVIGTKELGGLLFQGEKIKIEKNWEVVGWVLGQVILKFFFISKLTLKMCKINDLYQ